jgi:hypothetical protein
MMARADDEEDWSAEVLLLLPLLILSHSSRKSVLVCLAISLFQTAKTS